MMIFFTYYLELKQRKKNINQCEHINIRMFESTSAGRMTPILCVLCLNLSCVF